MTDLPPGPNENTVGKLCSRRRFRSERSFFFFAIREKIAISSRFCEIFHIFILSSVGSILYIFLVPVLNRSRRDAHNNPTNVWIRLLLIEKGHKRSSGQRSVHSFLGSTGTIDRNKLAGFGRIGLAPKTVFFFVLKKILFKRDLACRSFRWCKQPHTTRNTTGRRCWYLLVSLLMMV